MVRGQKILVLGGPRRVLGGRGGRARTGGYGDARNPGPPKTPKSKKNTKHQSQRQKAKGKENNLTRQARKRGGGFFINFRNTGCPSAEFQLPLLGFKDYNSKKNDF